MFFFRNLSPLLFSCTRSFLSFPPGGSYYNFLSYFSLFFHSFHFTSNSFSPPKVRLLLDAFNLIENGQPIKTLFLLQCPCMNTAVQQPYHQMVRIYTVQHFIDIYNEMGYNRMFLLYVSFVLLLEIMNLIVYEKKSNIFFTFSGQDFIVFGIQIEIVQEKWLYRIYQRG